MSAPRFIHPHLTIPQAELLERLLEDRLETMANWLESAAAMPETSPEYDAAEVRRLARERAEVRGIRTAVRHHLLRVANETVERES